MRNTMLAIVVFIIGVVLVIPSCYYENPPKPLPIDPEEISFNTHVLPIFVKSCALEECHDGTELPDLRAANAYHSLQSGGYYNLTYPSQSKLFRAVDYSGGLGMPPSGQLPPLDRDLILYWIEKGAPND